MAAGGLLTVVAVAGLLGTAGAFHVKTVAGVGTFYVVFSGCDRAARTRRIG